MPISSFQTLIKKWKIRDFVDNKPWSGLKTEVTTVRKIIQYTKKNPQTTSADIQASLQKPRRSITMPTPREWEFPTWQRYKTQGQVEPSVATAEDSEGSGVAITVSWTQYLRDTLERSQTYSPRKATKEFMGPGSFLPRRIQLYYLRKKRASSLTITSWNNCSHFTAL